MTLRKTIYVTVTIKLRLTMIINSDKWTAICQLWKWQFTKTSDVLGRDNRTWYSDSSKTSIGPVTPTITRGCPENRANINPQTLVIKKVSLTPRYFSVFSPKIETKDVRIILSRLKYLCGYSTLRLWMKCFSAFVSLWTQ